MAKNDNLQDFLTDLAKAIRTRKRLTRKINPQDFSNEILSIAGDDGVAIINQEKSIEITTHGVTEVTYDEGFTGLSRVIINTSVPYKPKYTGHADAEGLRAIGWTDEDIAYYQEHGVNWNAENDEYHKVTDDNKALYGVLTANNISTYKDRIVYLPKIDTSAKTNMSSMFYGCSVLVAIPQLDTTNVTSMASMFYGCYSLASIPQLDTTNVTSMASMFYNCYSLASIPQLDTTNVKSMNDMFNGCHSLTSIPQLDTTNVTNMNAMFRSCQVLASIPQLDTTNVTNMSSMFLGCQALASIPQLDTTNVTNMSSMFYQCYSLASIPQLDTTNVTNMSDMFFNCRALASIPQLDTTNVKNMSRMFSGCYSLASIPQLDTTNVTNMSNMFYNCQVLASIPQLDTTNVTSMSSMFYQCYSLTHANIKNNKIAISFNGSPLLSKESLLYLINNEASTATFAITLKAYAYDKWSIDTDVVAALETHRNVSLTRAS